mgnify:CR=1 FL=1
MNVGDLVIYKNPQVMPPGYSFVDQACDQSYAIVLQKRESKHEVHSRIRVMWLGVKVPIQAKSFSVSGRRITTWISPKYFEVVNESR